MTWSLFRIRKLSFSADHLFSFKNQISWNSNRGPERLSTGFILFSFCTQYLHLKRNLIANTHIFLGIPWDKVCVVSNVSLNSIHLLKSVFYITRKHNMRNNLCISSIVGRNGCIKWGVQCVWYRDVPSETNEKSLTMNIISSL